MKLSMKELSVVSAAAVLLIFTAIPPAFSDVAITDDNFPDANFREYLLSEADTDQDGYLSDNEIASITIMEIFGKNINNLIGIEYFSALQELYCYTNNLVSLDVSRNEELLLLECDNNKLTRLDLRNNTKLLDLECEANNLSELDLSRNINLSYVKCYNQTLYNLTVSKDENSCIVDLSTYVSDTERITDVTAYDESGDVIAGTSFDNTIGVVVIPYQPKRIKYGYNVGFINDETLSMDVTVAGYTEVINEINNDSSKNCGGCNSGWSIFTLAAVMFVFSKRI